MAIISASIAGFCDCSAKAELLWGVNGHPLVSYPANTEEQQFELIKGLGGRSYRVDISDTGKVASLISLVAKGKKFNITILPVLTPPVDLRTQDTKSLYEISFKFAEYISRSVPEVDIWELGNELENFAIIQPCELRDDGSKYPCEWGPAKGVGPGEYYGPRYLKVLAVLKGLTDGLKSGSPNAHRAIGSAGWGHVGIFERLFNDGLQWDITVWHMYKDNDEWAFKTLSRYKKPIWITELNNEKGSSVEGETGQASGLVSMMDHIVNYAQLYDIQAVYVYELLDEQYWAPSFEASMGLVKMFEDNHKRWVIGDKKSAYWAVKAFIENHQSIGAKGAN